MLGFLFNTIKRHCWYDVFFAETVVVVDTCSSIGTRSHDAFRLYTPSSDQKHDIPGNDHCY